MTHDRSHRSSVTPRSAAQGAGVASGARAQHPTQRLQQQIGNRQVARMLAQRAPEEEEPLQMQRDPALQRAPEEEEPLQMQRDPALQRVSEEEEPLQMQRDPALQRAPEEEGPLQMQRDPALQRKSEDEAIAPEGGPAGGPLSRDLAARIDARRGGGAPLDNVMRTRMEGTLGAPLDNVRLHTDGEAASLSHKLGAKAFTTGSDVFFGKSGSPSDERLLAHELTHVVQQRSISGGGPTQVGPAGDSYEQEAETVASNLGSAPAPSAAAPAAQRLLEPGT